MAKLAEVAVGQVWTARVSGRMVRVRVDSITKPDNWRNTGRHRKTSLGLTNLNTGRPLSGRSAAFLRTQVKQNMTVQAAKQTVEQSMTEQTVSTKVVFVNADIVTAYNPITIGTKVLNPQGFNSLLLAAILATDFENQDEPGQAFIMLPGEAAGMVSAGMASRSENDTPEDHVIRHYREGCKLYLKRSVAEEQGRNKADGAAAVVYTLAAYLDDPDLDVQRAETEKARAKIVAERQRVVDSGATHITVAILGFYGPPSPLSAFRFCHNLAGGNNEAAKWGLKDIYTKAKEIVDYSNKFITVAD